jgi:hypothetical protein
MMDEAELVRLNEQIGAAEQNGEAEFLRGVLAEELVFRRASGSVVSKEQYLADVTKNMFERESKNIKVTFDEENNLALVVLVVHARGSDFQNLRVFRRRENGWQCLVWFNTKAA